MVPRMKRACLRMCGFVLIISFLVFLNACKKPMERVSIQDPKIVFLSNRDAPRRHFDIFIMNMDGSKQTNLTDSLTGIRTLSNPLFSPDQRRILYLVFEDGKKTLQLMNIDGSNRISLAEVSTDTPDPRFSPNGSYIVFVSIVNGRRQIHIVDIEGKNLKNLSNNDFDEFDPSLSPNGSRIVFVSKRDGSSSIFVMNKDGSNRSKLTDDLENERHPRYSPDGSKIVFSSSRDGNHDIHIMKSNGKNLRNLTKSRAFDTGPKISPDGSKIAFVSNRRGMKYRDICIIDRNGTHFKNLTSDLNYINQHPIFTPDGKSIIFDSVKFNDSEIYKVNSDGQNLENLTNHPKWDQVPSI